MSVDFPAPLGPSRPIACPCNDPVSPSSTMRFPSRTSSPLRSMMPMSLFYVGVGVLVPGIDQSSKRQQVKSEHTAVACHFDAAFLSPRADRCRSGIHGELTERLRRLSTETGKQGSQHRAQVRSE